MLSKKALKNWLIALGVLLVLIVVVEVLQSRKKSSFRTQIVEIDTAKVSLIEFYKNGKVENAIDLTKKNGKWQVAHKDLEVAADPKEVKNLMTQILQIRPERLAAKSKDKWAKYNVVDSSAIHLLVKEGNKKTLDLLIGRFSAEKSSNPYSQRPDMYTYVRVNGEDETYLVEGFLSLTFDTDVSRFRNKKLCDLKRNDIKKMIFTYPDSSFTLENLNNKWMIDGVQADSASVAGYLSDISYLSSSNFASKERIEKAEKEPKYKLRIEGNNFKPVELKAFAVDSILLVRSSENPDGVFLGDKAGLSNKIFVSKNKFLKE